MGGVRDVGGQWGSDHIAGIPRWPDGRGLLVIPYRSPTAIPFCIIALEQGGASTLAALIVTSGLFQLALSLRLSAIRRLVTPSISGAVLILLVITVVPVIFEAMSDVPAAAPAAAALVCILVTFGLIMGLLIRGSGVWRVWSSLIGIAADSVAGIVFGIFDFGPVRDAPAAGLPLDRWAGLELNFGAAYWSLLPAFLFLGLLSLLQGTSIGPSIQRVSWRQPRAMDYRRVQGLSVSTALENLLAGFAAVMPLATSPRGTFFVQQTSCAARSIGVATGVLLIAAAFFPKSWSLLIGITRGPVVARAPFAGPSTTTCTLVPDQPYELMPALGGRWGASGHFVDSVVILTGRLPQSNLGLGLLKWRCFGMTPCCIDSMTFINPATPAAGSK